MSGGLIVRPAEPADAHALAAIEVRAWRHGYAGFLDEWRLAELDVAGAEKAWRERLDVREGSSAPWIAAASGRIAGVAAFGASRDADAEAGTGELFALYVDPAAQGAGLGSLLLERAIGSLRDAGCAAATLWVFAENGLARRFCERRGWSQCCVPR